MLKKISFFLIKIIILEYLISHLHRLLCFYFNWGFPFQIPEEKFWQFYFYYDKIGEIDEYCYDIIIAPFLENFFFLIAFLLLVMLGEKKLPSYVKLPRVSLFFLLWLFLFPYIHINEPLTYRFTSLMISITFMLYVFLHTLKLSKGNIFLAYLASVIVHMANNIETILANRIAYDLLGIK